MDDQSIEKNIHPEESNLLENNDFMSPVEHILIGSSVRMENRLFNSRDIIQEGPQFYLSPIVLDPSYENRVTLEEAKKARHDKCMEGFFPVFVFEKDLREYEQRIWLPELQDDGTINPRFRVQIIKYDRATGKYSDVSDIALTSKLKIQENFEDFFALEDEIDEKTKEKTGELILSIKPA